MVWGATTLLLFIIGSSTSISIHAQESLPERTFGVVDGFANSPEATTAGATWTRIFLRWDVIQAGGISDWKPANVPDPLLETELSAGREVVAVLMGTPPWATESGAPTAVPPLELWGEFVFKIATQYKGRITHWVIWNQPDVSDPNSASYSWAGTEADYYQLLKEAYLKIKAVDPTMQVHLAGLSNGPNRQANDYLDQLLTIINTDPEAPQFNYYFDAITFHAYYDPTQLTTTLPAFRQTLNSYGLNNKPIWVNELNAPPSEDPLEAPQTTPPFQVTLQEQSAFVIQSMALGLASGAERIAFNKLHTAAVDALPYGLLRQDNSRRPAFVAYQMVTTHFAGGQQATMQQIGQVRVVTINRGEQTTTVVWNMAQEPTTFYLNAIAPQALLIDDQGVTQQVNATAGEYALPLPGAICRNGDYCFIGGMPRLLVESGSVDQRVIASEPTNPTPVEPTATPTSLPVEPTPTNIPPILPPAEPPTITPTSTPISVEPTITAVITQIQLTSTPVPAAILPNPDGIEPASTTPITIETATQIPEVSLSSVITPERALWLFLIGLVVFMASYGIQVMIWYRIKH